ncbi:hypothetical protein ACPXAT_27350, partial [Klebsiella pneumoniae]|uniref:hypothetical protein n=1 Tax=Klebsiella pneumoniae TaxID=573 RepID=UPI003CEBF9AE
YHFPTYDNVLHHVVSGDAVNYEALKSDEMRKELDSAVDELAKLNPDQMESQQEQTCFWINSYNLLVLKAITDLYP